MRGNLFCTLSLSALLLACAHGKGTRDAEGTGPRADAQDAPRQAEAGRDDDGVDSDGDGRDRDRVALPERSEEERARMATAGDELPRSEERRRERAEERAGTELDALDQGNSEIDLDLTQRVRRAVMDDDSLSFKAKNVQIITRDGHVTLRGTVKTPEEKAAIGKAAIAAAGAAHVTNQLEVGE